MRNKVQSTPPSTRYGLLIMAMFVTATILTTPFSAFAASPPAGTKITNTATVTWLDSGGGSGTDNDTAVITVDFKATDPTITLTSPTPGTYDEGDAVTINYTITSNANGLDPSIALDAAVAETTISATTGSIASSPITTLGASALIQATIAAGPTFYVPNDLTVDGVVHGIAVDDKVMINGIEYTVESAANNGIVENDDSVNGWTKIKLTTNLPATGILTGVYEIQTFSVTFTAGDIDTSGSNTAGSYSTTVTASYNNNATTGAAQGTAATNVTTTLADITINKYAAAATETGSAFITTSATAKSGDEVIYRIVLENTSATKSANTVEITDSAPVYTSYVSTSGKSSADATTTYGAATGLGDTDATLDGYTVSGNDITYTVGIMAPGDKVTLYFKVKID